MFQLIYCLDIGEVFLLMCSLSLGEWDGVVIELNMNGRRQGRLLTYQWRNLVSSILTGAVCLLTWYTEKKMSLVLSLCTLTSCKKKKGGHHLNLITRTCPINPNVGTIYVASGMWSSKVSVCVVEDEEWPRKSFRLEKTKETCNQMQIKIP